MRSRERFVKFRVIKRKYTALVYDNACGDTNDMDIEIVIPGAVSPSGSVWERYVNEFCEERGFVLIKVTAMSETVEQVMANKIDIYYNCTRNKVYELENDE